MPNEICIIFKSNPESGTVAEGNQFRVIDMVKKALPDWEVDYRQGSFQEVKKGFKRSANYKSLAVFFVIESAESKIEEWLEPLTDLEAIYAYNLAYICLSDTSHVKNLEKMRNLSDALKSKILNTEAKLITVNINEQKESLTSEQQAILKKVCNEKLTKESLEKAGLASSFPERCLLM